jgi:hypothetical protein
VPLYVIARVPVVVTGEPETDRKAGTVCAIAVTVPVLNNGVFAISKFRRVKYCRSSVTV